MNIFDIFKSAVITQSNPVVFEFGACDGTHTLAMVELLEATGRPYRYFAFEPVAELVPIIRDRMATLMPKIVLVQAAIGAAEGEFPFYKSDANYIGSSSIRCPKPAISLWWPDMKFEQMSVNVITLDAFCERNNVDHINFIWSDIQGAEGDLIAGGRRMLAKTDWLYTECDGGLYEGDIGEAEMLAMLPAFKPLGRCCVGNLILRNEATAQIPLA